MDPTTQKVVEKYTEALEVGQFKEGGVMDWPDVESPETEVIEVRYASSPERKAFLEKAGFYESRVSLGGTHHGNYSAVMMKRY